MCFVCEPSVGSDDSDDYPGHEYALDDDDDEEGDVDVNASNNAANDAADNDANNDANAN
jgi:hypothetical protein